MCGCFEVSDFVCFFTFFITAIVALLFVQYFFIYLDTEVDEKTKTFLFLRCFYFFLLTFLGCLVFAGVQRRSICLLKWPSRLLTVLLTFGLVTLTVFLWTLDRVHKQYVRDVEGKTAKLSIVIALVFIYYIGVHKLISQIQSPIATLQRHSNSNGSSLNANQVFAQSNQDNHPNLVEIFRSKTDKAAGHTSSVRQINVASNGVNYYQLLLEGSLDKKPKRFSSSYSVGTLSEV